MSELWGTAGGQQAAQAYNQNAQLFDLSMQEGQTKLQTEQLALQSAKQEQARHQAIIDGANKALAAQSGDPTETPADKNARQLYALATSAMEHGEPETGAAWAEKAATVQKIQAEAQAKVADVAASQWAWVQDHAGSVHDQASFDAFKALHQASGLPPMHGPFAQANYDPKLIEALQSTASAQMEKAKLAGEQAKAKAEEAEARQRDSDVKLNAAREDAERELANNRRKVTGGKAPSGYEWDTSKDEPTLKPIPGGKADVQAQAKAKQDNTSLQVAESQIDDLEKILNESKGVTGGMGFIRRGGEWLKSSVDGSAALPATDFASKMEALQAQAPQLLEMGKKLGLDQRKQLTEALSGLSTMTSGAQAKLKLENFRKVLKTLHGQSDPSSYEETKEVDGVTYGRRGKDWYPL